ncbi:MAG TPA: hypothetical protein VLB80_02485 [Candidatus Babeliales bacterium]|nr:hypothetical protein [Candidatus Babeliales bacterium]
MKINQIFILLLCTFSTLYTDANTLVITRGPICSGMGGYLSNMITSYDDSYKSLSQYDIFHSLFYQLLNDLFSEQMIIINKAINPENIPHAIMYYHVYFKNTAHEQQKQQTLSAIVEIRDYLNKPCNQYILDMFFMAVQRATMAQLYYHAACGHNVVWESGTVYNWENELELIKTSFTDIVTTLTCSMPDTMIKEWQVRNEEAINTKNASNRRLIKKVLESFFNCFKLATPDQQNIIIFTKNDFNQIMEDAAQYIKTVPAVEYGERGTFTNSEFTLEELFDFAAKIYFEFNFENTDQIALAPSLNGDVLLYSKNDCFTFAQNLINK